VCQAAAGASPDPAGTKKQIPIFPLNVVALPAAVVPLMIFEARWVFVVAALLLLLLLSCKRLPNFSCHTPIFHETHPSACFIYAMPSEQQQYGCSRSMVSVMHVHMMLTS
jgi:hypothetical protein